MYILQKRLIAAASGAAVLAMTGGASAFTGVGIAAQAWTLVQARERAMAPKVEFRDPSSFLIVRREVVAAPHDDSRATGGLIAVPDNARAGDPAFMDDVQDVAWEDEPYWDDSGAGSYTVDTVLRDGGVLGYAQLRGFERRGRTDDVTPRRRHSRDDREVNVNEDLHRRAQLQFAEAAQPRLAEQERGWRRAQMLFHRSTLTPNVVRERDGLRHEGVRAPERRRGR